MLVLNREISQILSYFLLYRVLSLNEVEIARKTGVFPKDTLQRLKLAEKKINQLSKN
jgi:hypothetical protein